jgi:hypothetical protein
MERSLQQQFLESLGAPIRVGELIVVQMDRVRIPSHAVLEIIFVGESVQTDNAAVIAVSRKGNIFFADSTKAAAVAVWDEAGLPRRARYDVIAPDGWLDVYNKYRVRHSSGLVTEDSFTGNAGMVVTDLAPNARSYECSRGPGPFDKRTLIFELRWREAPRVP